MYDHTTLKAFVAETAAKIAAEMCKEFTMHKDISLLMDDDIQSKITKVSVTMAHKLSIQLGRWWNDEFDDGTVMFDPDDSPTSEIERRLKFIGCILMDLRNRKGNL